MLNKHSNILEDTLAKCKREGNHVAYKLLKEIRNDSEQTKHLSHTHKPGRRPDLEREQAARNFYGV
jgi:hypothetical protein